MNPILQRPLFLSVLLLAACGSPTSQEPKLENSALPILEDVTEASGLHFIHHSGATGELHLSEAMGAGAALADFDGDGDLDAYLVQGGSLSSGPNPNETTCDQLFANRLVERGLLLFENVTEAWGVRSCGYGMGIAIEDVDGNGWLDIFVTNLGPNELWRQLDGGVFELDTDFLPTSSSEWSVSATFQDLNADGWPDLYVTNYVHFTPDLNRPCYGPSSARDYCGPQVYEATADQLLVNLGGKKF